MALAGLQLCIATQPAHAPFFAEMVLSRQHQQANFASEPADQFL